MVDPEFSATNPASGQIEGVDLSGTNAVLSYLSGRLILGA